MEKIDSAPAIRKDIAVELCSRIWRENHNRPFTIGWAHCITCSRQSGGLSKRRWNRRPDGRGCKLVNAAFDAAEAKRLAGKTNKS